MIKYKSKLREVIFYNRWKQRKHSRNGDWTLIGLSRWASCYEEYSYKLCFFGFEVHVWFKKIFISGATVKLREERHVKTSCKVDIKDVIKNMPGLDVT